MMLAQGPMKLASTLESVTVYRTGAVCLRTAPVSPADAARRFEVCGLPLATIVGSIRAAVVGDEGTGVVDVRPGFDVAIAQASDLSAESQALTAAEQECGRLSLQVDRLERQIGELRVLVPRFREPDADAPPRTADLAAMLALAEFVDGRLAEITARRRTVAEQLADARERQRSAAARLQEATSAIRTARTQVSRTAIVTLSAPPSQACALTIEYEVPGARWAPTYHLMLGEGDNGRLVMRAAIAQRTGEDWSAVRLALSTASLRRDATMPELRALRIGRSQADPPRAGWREEPPGLDALFADFEAARARLVPPRPQRRREEPAAQRMNTRAAPPPPSAPPPMPMQTMVMPAAPPASGAFAASMPAPQSRRASAAPEMAREEDSLGAARGGGAARSTMAFGGSPPADFDDESPHAFDEGGGGFDVAPPAISGPSSKQLDYHSQRMQGPTAPSRGRLLPADLDLLAVGVHVEVSIVVAALSSASNTATGVGHLPLPPDCVPVADVAGFDYLFEARAPADVPSTGTWTTIGVMDCQVSTGARYIAVPAVDSAVYRTIEVTNRSAHALLPGPVDVSRDGKFLVTTGLVAIAPGAVGRRIGLGVEESIAIARNTRYSETTGGLFGGTSVLQHEIDIEIDNRLGVEVEIDVRERIPVIDASEKDVKIEQAAATPPWVAVDEPEDGELVHGLRRWRVRVAARSKTKLLGGFHVRLPSDRMLVGGNRRS